MKYLYYFLFISLFSLAACKAPKIIEAKPDSEPTIEIEKTPDGDYKYKTSIGEAVPQFTFEAVDGKKYSMKDFKGKTVWLNFFATWCGPCLVEIPELNKLSEKHEDVIFISIGRDHTVEELIPFAENKKMTYLVGADPNKEIYSLFADKYIPRNYLINKKGKIVHQEIGYNAESFEELVHGLEKMIQ